MEVANEKPKIGIGRTPPKPNTDLEKIMAEFSNRQLDLIMSNVGAVQLTEGCSIACSFCFIDAKPFVREYIPFDILKFIANNFGSRFPKSVLKRCRHQKRKQNRGIAHHLDRVCVRS